MDEMSPRSRERAFSEYTIRELQNTIRNHEDRGRTDEPRYLEALEELGRRQGRGFDFQKSLELIRRAASERRFISYKELAERSGLEWSKVRYAANPHLGHLIEWAHHRGYPLISAIVVNQKNVGTGAMDPATLKGFSAAAAKLGYAFSDADAFLREQQMRVFEWAAGDEGPTPAE